jgi:hypothetical protein
LRTGESRGGGRTAQGADPLHDPPHLGIGRDQAFRVQFAERDMKRPLFASHLPQAVQRQMNAFANADSRGPDEQEGIGVEIIGTAQFLLQEFILLRGERSGKIAGLWREVFSTNEIGLNGVAIGGEIIQQPAELNEVSDASLVAQGRLPFTEPAEPAEQMGIAAQLRDLVKLWKGGAEIRQKLARGVSIAVYRAGAEGEGERPDLRFEDLFQVGSAPSHES